MTVERTRVIDSLPDAFTGIRKPLQRLLWREAPPDAEDIVQEAWLRLLAAERSHTVRDPSGYIYGVVERLLRDRRRREADLAEELIEDRAGESAQFRSTSDVETEVDTQRQLERAFSALPGETRDLLLLKLSGHSVSDIALAQRLPASTVKKQLAEALVSIAMQLTADGEPTPEES